MTIDGFALQLLLYAVLSTSPASLANNSILSTVNAKDWIPLTSRLVHLGAPKGLFSFTMVKKAAIKRVLPTIECVLSLLQKCGLVIADLDHTKEEQHCAFWGAEIDDTTLVGVVGLERYGTFGLVRSLAVDSEYRGQGIGKDLLSEMERYALDNNLQQLYLLTTTAANFFVQHGYCEVERRNAPESIRTTTEFSSLCPCSATLMTRRLL